MLQGADMGMTQLILIAGAFGIAISVAIEFLNRYQIRAFYGVIGLAAQGRPSISDMGLPSVRRTASLPRCAVLAVVLAVLAFGSIAGNLPCVVAMAVVIVGYLGYVSWSEIRRLRFGR
jgi:hypothetical protein